MNNANAYRRMFEAKGCGYGRICNCIGPQNGQPVCPCRMRLVKIRNGRYVLEQDLGPAPSDISGTTGQGETL